MPARLLPCAGRETRRRRGWRATRTRAGRSVRVRPRPWGSDRAPPVAGFRCSCGWHPIVARRLGQNREHENSKTAGRPHRPHTRPVLEPGPRALPMGSQRDPAAVDPAGEAAEGMPGWIGGFWAACTGRDRSPSIIATTSHCGSSTPVCRPRNCGRATSPTTRPTPGSIRTSSFPVDTLRALAADGVIGDVSPRAYAFMGGIYSARRVRETLAPEISRRLAADQVDLALLVPV